VARTNPQRARRLPFAVLALVPTVAVVEAVAYVAAKAAGIYPN
jgi:hypothetical protein